MRALVLLTALVTMTLTSLSQTRIDSSFAFGPNPAKKYSIYVPASYNPSTPNPLMVGFHPLDTSRWDSESWCDSLITFGTMNDLIIVCPDGDSTGNITDSIDYAFTTALIDSMKLWYNIDDRRVYSIGFSMGGKAVYEYGLNNVETIKGFIPVGAAINGTSFVSNVIHNSGGMPFYLVHGANDAPNTRFYPMLNELRNNCAVVDSILMPGVGHTFDFPNRNQIISDAYQWVDSVNLTPLNGGGFSLQEPLNLSTLTIKGFHEYTQYFKWGESALKDTCGVLKYEVLFDVPNGNFSSPLLRTMSDNGGLDTILSLENEIIDSIMRSFNVQINGSMVLDWTVRSNIANRHSDTAKSFRITFIRKKLGFSLSAPGTNTIVTLTNGNNQFFNWQDLNHYISVTYNLLFDDTAADFSNPLISYLSTSGGSSSSLNPNHEQLYYDLMFPRGLEIGDTMHLKWRAHASDTIYSEFSQDERNITLVRGQVGFKLFEPLNNSILTSKKDIDYVFRWDSVLLSGVRYEILFDTLGSNLKDSASFILASNNDSLYARKDITFEIMDSMMSHFGIDYLDTLYGQWTVRAHLDSVTEYSLTTYKFVAERAHPVGIEDIIQNEIKIFPNPADTDINIQNDGPIRQVTIFDTSGRIRLQKDFSNGVKIWKLDITDLEAGQYIIQVIDDDGKIVRHQVVL